MSGLQPSRKCGATSPWAGICRAVGAPAFFTLSLGPIDNRAVGAPAFFTLSFGPIDDRAVGAERSQAFSLRHTLRHRRKRPHLNLKIP